MSEKQGLRIHRSFRSEKCSARGDPQNRIVHRIVRRQAWRTSRPTAHWGVGLICPLFCRTWLPLFLSSCVCMLLHVHICLSHIVVVSFCSVCMIIIEGSTIVLDQLGEIRKLRFQLQTIVVHYALCLMFIVMITIVIVIVIVILIMITIVN